MPHKVYLQDIHDATIHGRERESGGRLPDEDETDEENGTRLLEEAFLSGYHAVFTLDFMQHEPISGPALFKHAARTEADINAMLVGSLHKEITGHVLWRRVDSVIILTEQFRFRYVPCSVFRLEGTDHILIVLHCSSRTPSGKKLWDLVQLLFSTEALTEDAIGSILDTVNSRVCTSEQVEQLLLMSPKAAVLRNVLKPILNMYLAKNHACQLGKRFTYWRCHDYGLRGKEEVSLSHEFLNVYLDSLDATKTGKQETWLCFFEGCHYIFNGVELPTIGWFTNGTCTGVKLLLHPDEPEDNLQTPLRRLKYPPRAIFVRPDGIDIGDLLEDSMVPPGCIPITPRRAEAFAV